MPAQKRFFGFLFLILGLIFWVARGTTPCYGANLLENPGFESGQEPWSKYGGTLEIDDTIYHSGNTSAKFINNTTRAYYIKQSLSLEPDKSYKLEVFVKGGEVRNAQVWLKVVGEELDIISDPILLPENFTLLSIPQFDVPNGVTSVEVRAYLDPQEAQEMIAYFDDFSLEETALPTNTPIPTATPEPTSTPTNTPTPTPTSTSVSYPSGVYISEFMANPESGDDEWVEIHNTNSEQVVLTDWYIDDKEDGGVSPKKFSATISAGGYYTLNLTSGTLHNSGDDVRLLNLDGEEVDKKSYSETTKGKSWSKDSNGNWCQIGPTKNQSNPSCPGQETPTPTSTPTPTPTPWLIPTSTSTPTKIPTSTPTPSGEILGATEAGEATFSLHLEDEKLEDKKSPTSPHLWPKVLIGLGLVLIVGACYPLWLPRLKMLYNKRSLFR